MIRDNEMINVFDVERVLGDLPIDIIKENIKTQIDDPLTFVSNQSDQVYETLQEAMNEFGHIDEYRNEIIEMEDNFSLFLVNELNTKFNLGIDLDSISDYEVHEIAKCSYEFFVVYLRENVTRFLTNYIYTNKTSLSEAFGDEYKRKDVTTNNMKKITKDKDFVVILSNIISIINYILDLEHDPEDFMELAIEPGEYCGEVVKEAVRSFKLANNFVYNVLNEVKYAHNDLIDEIASEIIMDMRDNLPVDPIESTEDFE